MFIYSLSRILHLQDVNNAGLGVEETEMETYVEQLRSKLPHLSLQEPDTYIYPITYPLYRTLRCFTFKFVCIVIALVIALMIYGS